MTACPQRHNCTRLAILLTTLIALTSSDFAHIRADEARNGTSQPFSVHVVDSQTGRGVPLVELTTMHQLKFVTDSAGRAVIRAPELQGQRVYLSLRSHGYRFRQDGFGFRGLAVQVQPGKTRTIPIERINIAERLYRITGAGIYADTVELELPAPIRHPLSNAQVLGSDSVVSVPFRDRIYWFWGDTKRFGHPLGNFHVPGATSLRPESGGLAPDVGVNLEYFRDESGFASETCHMPGPGPTWIGGAVVVQDAAGHERLFAGYVKVRGFLNVYERGIVEFNASTSRFEKRLTMNTPQQRSLAGHQVKRPDTSDGYIYLADPYPFVRVPADVEGVLNPERWEAFGCCRPTPDGERPTVERDAEGRIVWKWRRGAAPISTKLQQQLITSGQLHESEAWIQLRDVASGQPVTAHRGSVAWNAFRGCWIQIATQVGGDSQLGEVWYAESDRLEGPWKWAVKVVTHDDYSFYNPRHHPFFDQAGGRLIYFEGTYTRTFSGNPTPTPRYDYNQVMYRLDLQDFRLDGLRHKRSEPLSPAPPPLSPAPPPLPESASSVSSNPAR